MSERRVTAQNAFLVVMGVAGTGKTEIARRLARHFGSDFVEADELHSAGNVEQMRKGIPLTDDQRWPWLEAVCDAAMTKTGPPVVIACSALKRSYRDLMRRRLGAVRFLFLDGTADLIAGRLQARTGHFASLLLFESQMRTLEPPEPDENAIRLDIAFSPDEIVQVAIGALAPGPMSSRPD